jgi:hypothetical protein
MCRKHTYYYGDRCYWKMELYLCGPNGRGESCPNYVHESFIAGKACPRHHPRRR